MKAEKDRQERSRRLEKRMKMKERNSNPNRMLGKRKRGGDSENDYGDE